MLYLAGEPLDEPTASWVSNTLDVPVIDNYWQTESGWPIMAIARGLDDRPTRLGSPGVPMYGYNVQLLNEVTGEPCGVNEKGMLVVEGPLPPGCIQTIWGDDGRFVKTYWSLFSRPVYATFDWGIRDADGYHFILGRTDDVINVAGHRLGTREIEESISSHPGVAEVAVVGVKDALKGQVAVAFVIPKRATVWKIVMWRTRKRRRLWRWWTARLATLAARRTSGLSRNCQKRDPEKCCAARSRRFAKDAILEI